MRLTTTTPLPCSVSCRAHLRGEHAFREDPEIERAQVHDAADHQAGADQQAAGERDLDDVSSDLQPLIRDGVAQRDARPDSERIHFWRNARRHRVLPLVARPAILPLVCTPAGTSGHTAQRNTERWRFRCSPFAALLH
ncbi:MAG: hypothetical protein WEF86_12745 [Gemmatimonadota bacterium]